MADEVPFRDMRTEELEDMLNPLSDDDISALKDVDAIVDATERLMTKAEAAGLDVSAQRAELQAAKKQAQMLIAAFGYKQA